MRTDIGGVGEFIGDILEAAQFNKHLQAVRISVRREDGPVVIALPSPEAIALAGQEFAIWSQVFTLVEFPLFPLFRFSHFHTN